MSNSEHTTILALLSRALHQIRSTPPRVIASPATQPRRAAVALVIRVSPPPGHPLPQIPLQASPTALTDFFQQAWVKAPGARPEILFLKREQPSDGNDGRMGGTSPECSKEATVAFPGGRAEEGDEGGMYTAMRQTWEETGLDLAESAYTPVGQLDDREITTSLGKRLLMILSPYVFLQLSPQTTPVDPVPGTTLHWVPLTELLPDTLMAGEKNKKYGQQTKPRWSSVTVDASSRLASRHSTVLRLLVRLLVGSMQFPAIVITAPAVPTLTDGKAIDEKRGYVENGHNTSSAGVTRQSSISRRTKPSQTSEELKLWGLSLGMTLDLLAHLTPAVGPTGYTDGTANGVSALVPPDAQAVGVPVMMAPSLTSVFPRFSYPDVNFWIWVFGKRYREVIRGWEASARSGAHGANDRRINWSGSALNTFYAAVRKALVVVMVVRAIWLLVGLVLGTWWLFW